MVAVLKQYFPRCKGEKEYHLLFGITFHYLNEREFHEMKTYTNLESFLRVLFE